MIYIIRSGDYMKVGYTSNHIRLGAYKCHNPLIEVIGTIKGVPLEVEQAVHSFFIDSRVNGRKEWYNYNDYMFNKVLEVVEHVCDSIGIDYNGFEYTPEHGKSIERIRESKPLPTIATQ